MNKTILMLINGFGVEKGDSTPIYSAKLMPNLDSLTTSAMFSSLSAPAGDYNSGYKAFSIESTNSKKNDFIDNLIYDGELKNNVALKEFYASLNKEKKLHILYVFNEGEKFNQIREIIKSVNADKSLNIYLHYILTSTSLDTYKTLKKITDKAVYELNGYAHTGIVVGKSKLNGDNFQRIILREQGEHWANVGQKLNVLEKDLITPENVEPFLVETGFSLEENDQILYFNYEHLDINVFVEKMKSFNLNYYSIYEESNMKNLYKREVTEASCFTDLLSKYKINATIFTSKDRLNDLNFYLNGEKRELSKNIAYLINDDNLFNEENVLNTINSASEAIILDYDIGHIDKIGELKEFLGNLDKIIGNINKVCNDNKYCFIISSVYGIQKLMMDGPVQRKVNFSSKVPLIFKHHEFKRPEYSLNGGTLLSLELTYLTNICDDVKQNKLVHKKNKLEMLLSKK